MRTAGPDLETTEIKAGGIGGERALHSRSAQGDLSRRWRGICEHRNTSGVGSGGGRGELNSNGARLAGGKSERESLAGHGETRSADGDLRHTEGRVSRVVQR